MGSTQNQFGAMIVGVLSELAEIISNPNNKDLTNIPNLEQHTRAAALSALEKELEQQTFDGFVGAVCSAISGFFGVGVETAVDIGEEVDEGLGLVGTATTTNNENLNNPAPLETAIDIQKMADRLFGTDVEKEEPTFTDGPETGTENESSENPD